MVIKESLKKDEVYFLYELKRGIGTNLSGLQKRIVGI